MRHDTTTPSALDKPELRLEGVSAGSLSGISLSIAPGCVTALSGPSGSGKSRLLRAIADLESHDGHVALGGIAQSAIVAHRWRSQVMLVPADSQWWGETVGEHFPDPEAVAWAALGFPGEVADWQISRLSSGERQRLALLRAIAHGPQALLLDEPTANLDPAATTQVENWLLGLIRAKGWPTLWVSHDQAQIGRVADAHLCIHDDRLESMT